VAELILLVVRGAVALCCGAAGIVALVTWLGRQGTINPFGAFPRWVRSASAWAVRPMEHRVTRLGGNPQHAPYWLLGFAVVGGLVLISTTQWVIGYAASVSWAFRNGPRGILAFAVASACDLFAVALFVRVIGSWFGIGRYTPWMRPVYTLTDWAVLPIQRLLPKTGMIDFSPMVAWILVVYIVRPILLGLIAGR
jgi:YggT family protein